MTSKKNDKTAETLNNNTAKAASSSRKVMYFGIFVVVISLALGARTYLSDTSADTVHASTVAIHQGIVKSDSSTPEAALTIVDVELESTVPALIGSDTDMPATDVSEEDLAAAQLVQATLQLAKSQQEAVSATTYVAVNTPQEKPAMTKVAIVASVLPTLYQAGGNQVREVLNTITQAGIIDDTYMLELLNQLRVITPRQGPTTLASLHVMLAQVVRQGAPEGYSAVSADETKPQTSWWRKQIDNLVKVTQGDPTLKTLDAWTNAMNATELLLVLNNVNDAKISLNQAPLKNDARLDNVRQEIDTYLSQQAKLYNVQHYALQSLN